MKISEQIPISALTTMRLGGAVQYLIGIETIDDLKTAYDFADTKNLPTYIIGGGSNIIGRDEGYNGIVLLNKLRGIEAVDDTAGGKTSITLRAMTGEILDELCELAAKRGYTGIEALSAIPGTVGGAIMQNSGAYGQQLSDSLVSVQVFDITSREIANLSRDQLDLSYRHSIFNNGARGRYFLISATIELHRGDIAGVLFQSLQDYLDENDVSMRDPLTIRRAVTDIRSKKLPDPAHEASAGSFFKNYKINPNDADDLRAKFPGIPIFKIGDTTEIASGWLIEQAGLKGKILHGMKISDKAALVLINDSARSYADLAAARAEVINAVYKKFGLKLEQEPEEI